MVTRARGEMAAARAHAAGDRIEELRVHLAMLRSRIQGDEVERDRGSARVSRSALDARAAAQRLVFALVRAAEAHRAAADCFDRVGETERGASHWIAAAADDSAAELARLALGAPR